jgi:acyl-coenzyme A synthetase/AMP-(fatty) acid ligase
MTESQSYFQLAPRYVCHIAARSCTAHTVTQNALAILSISAYHTCAPMNASCTAQELFEDSGRLGIKAIVTSADAEQRLELHHLRQKLGCEIIYLTPKPHGPAGLFELSLINQADATPCLAVPSKLHGLNDYSLILHTSGTSGKKKVVPYTLRNLLVGTLAVIKSWGLRSNDVNSEFLDACHRINQVDWSCSEHDAALSCWWNHPQPLGSGFLSR